MDNWHSYPHFAKFDRGVYAKCAVVAVTKTSDHQRFIVVQILCPRQGIRMNGAPEIERHAYGVSLFYWTATRSLKYIKGGAWGASAPRLRAQARDTRDRFPPRSRTRVPPNSQEQSKGEFP